MKSEGGEAMKNILLVDDSDEVRDVMCRLLSRCGFFVEAYSSCERAIEAIKESIPNAVLTDFDLGYGRMNGLQFIEEIRKIYPGIPMAMITASTDKFDVLGGHAKRYNFTLFEKPCDWDLLIAFLNRAILSEII